RARNSEGPRFRAVRPADIDFGRFSVPGGGRQNRLPVRSEPRAPDRSLPIGQLLEGGRFRDPLRLAHEIAASQKGRGGERTSEQGKRTEARGRGGPRGDGGGRRSRERLEIEGEVVRRVESLLGALLEAMTDDALQPRLDVLV